MAAQEAERMLLELESELLQLSGAAAAAARAGAPAAVAPAAVLGRRSVASPSRSSARVVLHVDSSSDSSATESESGSDEAGHGAGANTGAAHAVAARGRRGQARSVAAPPQQPVGGVRSGAAPKRRMAALGAASSFPPSPAKRLRPSPPAAAPPPLPSTPAAAVAARPAVPAAAVVQPQQAAITSAQAGASLSARPPAGLPPRAAASLLPAGGAERDRARLRLLSDDALHAELQMVESSVRRQQQKFERVQVRAARHHCSFLPCRTCAPPLGRAAARGPCALLTLLPAPKRRHVRAVAQLSRLASHASQQQVGGALMPRIALLLLRPLASSRAANAVCEGRGG